MQVSSDRENQNLVLAGVKIIAPYVSWEESKNRRTRNKTITFKIQTQTPGGKDVTIHHQNFEIMHEELDDYR